MDEYAMAGFLTAEWRHLLMLNYEVDPGIIEPYAPRGTELDRFDGRTFVSVVGFLFLNTRVMGLQIPFHVNFEEVNLRTYVRFKGHEGWRRGVVFIKEIVPRRLIAWTARTVFNEKYVAHPMHHYVLIGSGSGDRRDVVEYGWRLGEEWQMVRATPTGELLDLEPGTRSEFIAEHYWGYSEQQDGGTIEYRVEHAPWRIRAAREARLECDVERTYGAGFAETLKCTPDWAFVAEGSSVAVSRGRRCT